jgi:hypothetical protein
MNKSLGHQDEICHSHSILRFGVVILLIILLVGCNGPRTGHFPENPQISNPTWVLSQSPLPSATNAPVPASAFEIGAVEFPRGQILLLGFQTWRVCSNKCDCPEVEVLWSGYTIDGDRLLLSRYGMDHTWAAGSMPAIIYAYGDFEEALVAVNELPFTPERGLPILSAMETGTIV